MKPKIKTLLEEADQDQLLEIIMALCDKYKQLPEEIEFILSPKNIKNPQSYYNKLVKKAIDTNSWSKFPNKGVKGLQEMVTKLDFLEKIGNIFEAQKLAKAILDIISRCKRKYNSQNEDLLLEIKIKLQQYW
ncbi:MAG: hypothetical protein WCK98_02140 [bacterium]